jgi:hypothetical protein
MSQKNGGNPYIATNITGARGGKVIAMGDSSPYDDGSGDPRDKLHDGYNNPRHDHEQLAHNTIKWLLKKASSDPGYRMNSLMKNIQAINVDLKKDMSEEKFLLAENLKANLSRLLNESPYLHPTFSAQAQGKQDFEGLLRQIRQRESFSTLHER